MGEAIVLIWMGLGIVGHVWGANQMKTWCGTPVWEEPSTYLMFVPAIVAGPLMFLFVQMNPPR